MNIKSILSYEVCRALAGLKRTEDVKFSPCGRRLVIAGFNCNKIPILIAAKHQRMAGRIEVQDDVLAQT
jgi:hypothetical protein